MSAQVTMTVPATPVESPATPPKPLAPPKISVQEYFELERVSEIRHEYVEGEIIPMPGDSLAHNRIAGNFAIFLDSAFEDRDCVVYMEGVRLRVSHEKYRYPDVMALCGEPRTDEDKSSSLLNPSLALEVLSPSTQETNRDRKFLKYREIPGLTDYILAAQDRVSVTHCVRTGVRQWTITEYIELADTLTFASLQVSLTLADIYRKVAFASTEPTMPAESPA